MSAVKLSYNFIEIKCQFLNYYKAPFNLKKKWQTSKRKMSAVKLLYNFIEIKCQFLNYYKAPFNF